MMSEDLLNRLVKFLPHAYQSAPAVRALFDSAGLAPADIRSFQDFERLPVTSKDRLVQLQAADPPFGGFLASTAARLEHIFLSPGPLFEPHAGESAVMESVLEMLTIAGIGAGEVVLNTFGYHLIPTGLALDQALRASGATVIPAGVGNPDLQVRLLRDLKASAYVGTPSWLLALIRKAEELGLDVAGHLSLRKALVSAEPLPASLRQTLVETYGLAVTNAYGTAELGFLAYNQEGGLAMRLLETSLVQIASPETGQTVPSGETGEVVVTSFNRTYPLIRLGTGDLAVNLDPQPGKSRQGERAIILVGRVGEAIKVRGMFVHPNQLRFALVQVPAGGRAQALVQRSAQRDELSLLVEFMGESSEREALEARLAESVRSACRVAVDHFEFVEPGSIPVDAPIIEDRRDWKNH